MAKPTIGLNMLTMMGVTWFWHFVDQNGHCPIPLDSYYIASNQCKFFLHLRFSLFL